MESETTSNYVILMKHLVYACYDLSFCSSDNNTDHRQMNRITHIPKTNVTNKKQTWLKIVTIVLVPLCKLNSISLQTKPDSHLHLIHILEKTL